MRVKNAVLHRVSHRYHARAALAAGLACTLMLSACSTFRSQSAAPADLAPAAMSADAATSAATANAGAQTTQVTKLQKFMWVFSPYRPDIQQGNFVSQEMLAQVKVGQTRDQVKFILGTPLLTDMFHADRWDYPFYLARGNGELTKSRVTVFFKDNQVARIDGGNLPTERQYIEQIAGKSTYQPPKATAVDAGKPSAVVAPEGNRP
jgi:outer membrane protein assembly factor BamE